MELIVTNKKVKTKDGLYCLNDLHKASGGDRKNGPSHFMALNTTKGLIDALMVDTDIPVSVIKGGKNQGTYVCEELVYAYAMWISPEFNLKVIRAFKAIQEGKVVELERQKSRNTAKMEAKFLTDAITYDKKGEAKFYHYSNEYDLINRTVLGMSAKQYRIHHGLAANQPIRDTLTKAEIEAIEHMQRLDTGMIELGYSYEQRKSELSRIFLTRHNKKLCAEVKKLQS